MSAAAAGERILAESGRVDSLVNNVGVAGDGLRLRTRCSTAT
ncbi:MAG: hypothetical protein ABSF95_09805 [Verrucomicrobiota bacterium]